MLRLAVAVRSNDARAQCGGARSTRRHAGRRSGPTRPNASDALVPSDGRCLRS